MRDYKWSEVPYNARSNNMDEVTILIRRARRGNSTTLDLSNKSICTWHADILKMLSLEELDLSKNSLSAIPSNIAELVNLKKLDLSDNLISELPAGLRLLPLEYLNLSGNKLPIGLVTFAEIQATLDQHCTAQLSPLQPQMKLGALQNSAPATPKQFAPANFAVHEVELGEMINQGGFSIVQRGVWRGANVAVKLIVDPIITSELLEEFENEVNMLAYLRHPNTILLMGVNMEPPHLAIMTEYASRGSLFEFLHKSREQLSEERKTHIVKQVAQVFEFYHYSGVTHRDLKSLNVLLDANFNVKICDFGLARFQSELNRGRMQFSGTPSYMAPELFKKQAIDGKVDVFAFGTLLWEVFVRRVPYDGIEPGDIKERVLKGDHALSLHISMPRQVETLVQACRSFQAAERPSFSEILAILSGI